MANNEWIDGRYLRQRRNLNATSITLLVYVLGGGVIESGKPINMPLDFAIKFETPEIIILFAWLALFYFMWRYWLISLDLRINIDKMRKNVYHFTPYVRNIIDDTIAKYDLQRNVAHGTINYTTGKWTLVFGKVNKNEQRDMFVNVPDISLPFFPFIFFSLWSEAKMAWHSPEFSEFYTPFLLSWLAILGAFLKPLFII